MKMLFGVTVLLYFIKIDYVTKQILIHNFVEDWARVTTTRIVCCLPALGSNNNRVDVRRHKYVSPSAARVKMSLRRVKNIFMPKNINCITIIISLKGNIRHKFNKIDCKQSNSRLSASCIYFVVLF